MPELNKEQEEAASFLEGIAAVIAVPGSGKTRTMMERIGKLVKDHGIAPESVLGLTFTRNAAEEMRNRLVPVLGDQASRVMLSTLHSFAYWVLKCEGKVFQILSGKEQLIFMRDILKKLRVKNVSVGMALREISLAKNNLITVDQFREIFEGDKIGSRIAEVYEAYDREKSKKLLLDFDDLLLETYQLFSSQTAVKQKYSDRFNHVLVDEFQDTNPVQLELIRALISCSVDGGSLWVCGDDWQSIYSFTGASVGNILNFSTSFEGSKVFILNLNYRSTPQILTACQNLIQHNLRKIEKTLETKNDEGDQVVVLEASNEEGEALNLVAEISDLISRKGYSYKDIAVLYRCNFQSRFPEELFSRMKIPYHIENGLGFYHRPEVKVLLDYLRLIINPDSEQGDEALKNVINVPTRYVSRAFSSDLEEFAQRRGVHLYEALKSMPIDVPYLRKFMKEFRKLLDPLIQDGQTLEPAEVISFLRGALDYDRYISDEDVPSPDDVKVQNVDQLQLSASRYRDIQSFLEYTDSFEEETSNDKEGVSLMTVHKSKGLEFPVVFVIGLLEGICPSKKGDIEEERRIAFVACSRAMKLLYLSYALNYLGVPAKKSIFIEEIMGTK
ncbi:MAG: ATP-dependent helicase [Deltaproteobacteria bacterium]|nr:ATP-dependent helicase [Deltaproteobacteria bacterium]